MTGPVVPPPLPTPHPPLHIHNKPRMQDGGQKGEEEGKCLSCIYDLSLHYGENMNINAPSAEKIHQRFSVIQSDDRTQVPISFQLQRRAPASKRKINDLRGLPGELSAHFLRAEDKNYTPHSKSRSAHLCRMGPPGWGNRELCSVPTTAMG